MTKDEELELIKAAQGGDTVAMETIILAYNRLLISIVRKYFLIGGNQEDLISEGMLGLFKAVNSFDSSKNDNFSAYATILIKREVSSFIKCFYSKKQQVLNTSILIDDDDKLGEENNCPECDIICEETFNELIKEITDNLSSFEQVVFDYYLKGYKYKDIAKLTCKTDKCIDNALSRIKKKLEYLRERL